MTVREIALCLLDEWESGKTYINLALSSHKADGLSPQERAFLTALLYGTVEHIITYDYQIGALSGRSPEKLDPHTRNILRLGLCQLCKIRSVPPYAAVSETVALGRSPGEKAFVNGVLRAASRSPDALPLPDKEKNYARYLSVSESVPLDKVKRLLAVFGEEETAAFLRAVNSPSPLTVTVNPAKTDRPSLLADFQNAGFDASLTTFSPYGIRLEKSVAPSVLPGFAEGRFFVQDEASQLAVLALDVQSGDSVADVCAAPGGKSFLAAALAGSEGRVDAFDLRESKLSLISSGAERLGLKNVTVAMRDASVMPTEPERYDRVICDVPCSGLGVLSKKPDLRYKTMENIGALPALGLSILSASAALVRRGGTLVFSTCTLLPEENEENVAAFLASHPDFSAEGFAFGDLPVRDGMLTTLPHRDGMDGFFIAKLRKKA